MPDYSYFCSNFKNIVAFKTFIYGNKKLRFLSLLVILSLPFVTQAQANTINDTNPVFMKKGLSLPVVFGGGTSISKTVVIDDNDLEVAAGGGLLFGAGIFYALPNNFKFGGIFQYQTSEVKQIDQKGSVTFKRYVIAPEMKIPIKLNKNSFLNIGGGYGFYLNGNLDFADAGPSKINGSSFYNDENGIHLLTEFEENFATGYFSIGLKYYNINYSFKNGDFNFNNLEGMGLDLYVTYSFRI